MTGERDPRIGAKRLRAVREALIAEGVAATRIHYAAFDQQRGACTQATSSCYELNRRVEVFFGERF